MKLIDRYIIRQYLSTFVFIMGIVLVICVLVDFVEKLDEFIDKNPPMSEIIFDYYLNFIPFFGNLLLPICVFLAVIFFTSRMSGRTEMIPMLGAGISFYRLLVPYLIASALIAGFSGYLKSYVIPQATAERMVFEYKYFKKKRISSRKHIHKKVAKDTYVYISFYDDKRKEGHTFALERFKEGEIITRINARKITWVDSTQSWTMRKVYIREIDGLSESMTYHQSMDTTFLLSPDDIYKKEMMAESMPLPELLRYITLEEMRGSDILQELYIERQRRFSDPVAVVILTLIGFALASRKRRGGIALNIGLGLVLCFLYIALLIGGQAMVGEDVEPWVAVWFPNMIYLPISLYLLWLAPK
ncbi:LptF/LptG family permease [Pontibacter sp. G13]|uniref:LptF/LptG family permease n=1 Tax=Pontibacter sp. G13 TaxID=3074898 RepID=UPI00288A9736|nr:LptF/LptG family permease [Pontibacter sp. G13]WNJ20828.1 LptF/LptG family permease [Pontibacter sp. G13]